MLKGLRGGVCVCVLSVLSCSGVASAQDVVPGHYPSVRSSQMDGALWVGEADSDAAMRFGGFVQLNAGFVGVSEEPLDVDVRWRRLRIAMGWALWGSLELRAQWELMLNPLVPYDLHLDWRLHHWLSLRAGWFKSPFGFERRARGYVLPFLERGFPTQLAPNRELGVYVYGQHDDGLFAYELAYVSGAADGQSSLAFEGGGDFAGRLYMQPARLAPQWRALRHLGLGFSWTVGEIGRSRAYPGAIAAIESPGSGRELFRYRSGVISGFFRGGELDGIVSDLGVMDGLGASLGRRSRQSVHGFWCDGRWSLLGEYVRSSQDVSLKVQDEEDGPLRVVAGELTNHAWQVVGSVALWGRQEGAFFDVEPWLRDEDEARTGLLVSARYQEIAMDEAAFDVFAERDLWARRVRAWSMSGQWQLNRHVELQLEGHYVRPMSDDASSSRVSSSELTLRSTLELRY
jgi:phosphate-selective porin OprO/OprP